MSEWYFAYGSNLWIDQLEARIGPIGRGDDRPRVGWLPDHRLVFNMQAEDGAIYANLELPGAGVYGAIYRCSSAALDLLDSYESGYERRRVQVNEERGITLEAVVYVAKKDCIACVGRPSADYLAKVIRGARRHCLPETYVRMIEAASRSG